MEKPILFGPKMIQAILDGRKTQTRRVAHITSEGCKPGFVTPSAGFVPRRKETHLSFCPYGQPGDTLWVREKFRLYDSDDECMCFNECHCRKYHRTPIYYASNGDDEAKWKPSIHMPREFSRINLRITRTGLERVQDISEEDAIAEGVTVTPGQINCDRLFSELRPDLKRISPEQQAFSELWDSINKKRGFGWEKNPWVWVVEFEIAAVEEQPWNVCV